MAGGRPTKFSDEVLKKTEDYIENFYKHDDLIPSVASLSVVLRVTRSTLYEWAKENKQFSDMLEFLNQKQEKVLLSGGLSGNMNATICKLVLSKHDYSDKVESAVDHTTKGEKINSISPHQFVSEDQ